MPFSQPTLDIQPARLGHRHTNRIGIVSNINTDISRPYVPGYTQQLFASATPEHEISNTLLIRFHEPSIPEYHDLLRTHGHTPTDMVLQSTIAGTTFFQPVTFIAWDENEQVKITATALNSSRDTWEGWMARVASWDEHGGLVCLLAMEGLKLPCRLVSIAAPPTEEQVITNQVRFRGPQKKH